jgi:competence protein ComEA
MKANGEDDRSRPPPWLLRRSDQIVVAALVALGLAFTIAWWLTHGGCRGTLVELEDSQPRQASFRVDLNTASWPELTQLPGIGETRAQRIVTYRETHGPFRAHDDLLNVKGIGKKTLAEIRPHLLPIAPLGNASSNSATAPASHD